MVEGMDGITYLWFRNHVGKKTSPTSTKGAVLTRFESLWFIRDLHTDNGLRKALGIMILAKLVKFVAHL